MKRLLAILALTLLFMTPTLSLAQNQQAPEPSKVDKSFKQEINKLFEIKNFKGNENIKKVSERIKSEKESSYSDLFANVAKTLTGVAVIMTFVGITVSGVIYIFSEGEEGRVTKARSILLYVLLGDLIIAVSYAIIRAITLIKPLE